MVVWIRNLFCIFEEGVLDLKVFDLKNIDMLAVTVHLEVVILLNFQLIFVKCLRCVRLWGKSKRHKFYREIKFW